MFLPADCGSAIADEFELSASTNMNRLAPAPTVLERHGDGVVDAQLHHLGQCLETTNPHHAAGS